MLRHLPVAIALLLAVVALPATAEFDDCDARFTAFIGSSAYQFSPRHAGELGAVRLFAILSYRRAASEGRFGVALWKLRITDDAGGRIFAIDGSSAIGREGAALAEVWWDGRDDAGRLVPAGTYHYTFVARYVTPPVTASSYDAVLAVLPRDEAFASTRDVVVNDQLTVAQALALRETAAATSCQRQQNAPMESGFPYNFYYGSTHSHSNYSDGGLPTSSCTTSQYGKGTFTPADVYAYARDTAGLDYWVVNEHNHLIQDAVRNLDPPLTESKVRQRYRDGLNQAAAASVDGSFVAIYGMEWGVTTENDQGHVTLLETPKLFGWESCSDCNGATAECTPGANCYFDVYTPKRFAYLTLYRRAVENPSPAGPLGILCHPGSSEFDGYAYDANADATIQGVAVRSGDAFTKASACAIADVGATDYSAQWKKTLNLGFHTGPTGDHDAHCNNFGVALPTRTVYLAPSLTKTNLLNAHRLRHFFASEDPNAQLVFRTADGAHVMGDIFAAGGGATLVANLYDPDGEPTLSMEVWRGQVGQGVPRAPYRSAANASTIAVTEPLSAGTYYYYVHATQADGNELWSSPMWITYGPAAVDGAAPSVPANLQSTGWRRRISLGWSASTDDVGVVAYHLYRAPRSDGPFVKIASTALTHYADTELSSRAQFFYYVVAADAAGNVSLPSNTVSALTR
jgi:hypothetical protein